MQENLAIDGIAGDTASIVDQDGRETGTEGVKSCPRRADPLMESGSMAACKSREMHLYAQDGHGFGLRPSKLPIAQWPRLVETWCPPWVCFHAKASWR